MHTVQLLEPAGSLLKLSRVVPAMGRAAPEAEAAPRPCSKGSLGLGDTLLQVANTCSQE